MSVISSSLRAKMAMSDLQRYPWNLFLLKYELWTVFSHLRFFLQNWLAHFLFIRSKGDSYRNKHVFSQTRIFWSAVKVFIRVPLEIRHCHLCMEGHLNITITVPLKGKFLLLSLLHRVIATISFWSEKMFKSTVVN